MNNNKSVIPPTFSSLCNQGFSGGGVSQLHGQIRFITLILFLQYSRGWQVLKLQTMAELPFDTFRLRHLEEAGLIKIPDHLKEYYSSRKEFEVYGFQIPKPITASELVSQCYDQVLAGGAINLQCRYYAIDVEDFREFYGFSVSLC